METKVFAIVSAVMSLMVVASGYRGKRSMQVKTYEKPELTDHGPIMSICTFGIVFLVERKPQGELESDVESFHVDIEGRHEHK